MKKNLLTYSIIGAMVLGMIVGFSIFKSEDPELISAYSGNIKLLATIFIRLVQMIIAPLVFCTLVVGIAKLGNVRTVSRIGGKAMIWFFSASWSIFMSQGWE